MESTGQYWPVWMALESQFALTLAQARSTRAPRGRKWDKADARRIAKRLLSGDLTIRELRLHSQGLLIRLNFRIARNSSRQWYDA